MSTETVDTSQLIEVPTIYNTDQFNVVELLIPNITTSVAGGAGQTVTVNVVFNTTTAYLPVLPGDTEYTVSGMASQACTLSYSAKTVNGFTLTLTPLTSGVTLSAGTVDLVVKYQNGGVQAL